MSVDATRTGSWMVEYEAALEALRSLVRMRRDGLLPDALWLLEHPATITLGKGADASQVLVEPSELEARRIALHRVPRGGGATAHEPGQLVGYPIVDIDGPRGRDLHGFLRAIEEALIAVLARFAVRAERVSGRTGVWIPGDPPRKIAALGVRVERWISSHGFALNVDNDLSAFRAIVPCGIADAGVTTLAREMRGRAPPRRSELAAALRTDLERTLGGPLELLTGRGGLARAGARRRAPRRARR